MSEPTSAIPTGGDSLQNLESINPGGQLSSTDPDSSSALDKMLLEVTGGEGTEELTLDSGARAAADAAQAKAAADEKIAADKKAAADAAKVKSDEEAAKLVAPAPKSAAADRFDEVVLPPYTKPKAAEAFATVKTLAREQAIADAKIITDLTTKAAELEEKVKAVGKLPPEVEKELAELRAFRAGLDVEADPKFREWDTKVNENVESIYSKLKGSGVEEAVILKIKEMGGPGEVDWDSLSEKLPAQVKRYIEGKLFENEDLVERKKKALTDAKSKAVEYVKTKSEAATTEVVARRKGVESKVKELAPNIEWLQDKTVATDAKPEERAAAETHNKRAVEIRATMQEAIENDSPEMKGLLVLGIAQLQRVNGEFESLKLTSVAEKAALEKSLKEVTDRLEKIKKSGTPRISSAAPSVEEVKSGKSNPLEDGSSALDRHLKEAQAAARAA